MTALEAIPKITELLARLIKLSKDREAAALVQQIQSHQLVIEQGLRDAYAERDAARKQADQLTATHDNVVSALRKIHLKEVSDLNDKVRDLEAAINKTAPPNWGGKTQIQGRMG
jgi:hypothetical protein